jgi:hypothetical protein
MAMSNTTRDGLRNGHAHNPISPANPPMTPLQENAALRARVEELEQELARASVEGDERWAERQREYEALLEEKSEVIRALHQKMAELREQAPAGRQDNASAGQTLADREEMLKLKQELEERRRQIADDEESMMLQLRDMEMALARDRAELARQRAELQRLHNELKHEMEMGSRDSGLRERLVSLQRRTASASLPARPGPSQDTPAPVALPKAQPPSPSSTPSKGSGSIFRRLFGSSE